LVSTGGRPRREAVPMLTLIQRRASASQSIISIRALTLRKSPAAARSMASCNAGSIRSAKALRVVTCSGAS